MKIEIGESLIASWLRHIKECQLVQTNWKGSNAWELKNIEKLKELMLNSEKFFYEKYKYKIFKENKSMEQLIKQAEIDVVGITFPDSYIYCIDVAFHENGLNYGSKEETISRVIKKIIRTIICIVGYFGIEKGEIIFASPKIHKSVLKELNIVDKEIQKILEDINLNFEIKIIANEFFLENVFNPVISILDNIADTSELFVRSLQMYNLFKKDIKEGSVTEQKKIDIYSEMKIGVIARTILKNILENGKISKEEILLLQDANYSKQFFDIQYPLLKKIDKNINDKIERYYINPIKIYDELYYMCSEWYENDRALLINWLEKHK